MSQSVWGYWIISLGIGVMTVMMLVQNYTTINQEDYYLLKEVTQAAMNDAIDYNHYRQYGELKINREKFIENFERRFAESVKGNKNYQTDFYEIYETPPKVSVKVSTKTQSFQVSGDTMDLDVSNTIDAILENNSTNTVTKMFYSVPYGACPESRQDTLGYCKITNNPFLSDAGITDYVLKVIHDVHKQPEVTASQIEIISAKYIGNMTEDDYKEYIRNYKMTYGIEYTEVNHRAPISVSTDYSDLLANDIVDVKLTVRDNQLFWAGKYKCNPGRGFASGVYDIPTDGTEAYDLSGQCLLGIKYELKFSY